MKFGYFVGYVLGNIVANNKPMMMEEFMNKYHIENTQDVVLVSTEDKQLAENARFWITKQALIFIHGESSQKVLNFQKQVIDKKTGYLDFFSSNNKEGKLDGKLPMHLMEFVFKLQSGELHD